MALHKGANCTYKYLVGAVEQYEAVRVPIFVSLDEIKEDANAINLTAHLVAALQQHAVLDGASLRNKCVGLAADGASVLQGSKNGLVIASWLLASKLCTI